MKIKISDDFEFDFENDIIKDKGFRLAIIGESGSGKSWTTGLLIEKLLDNGCQVCVVDTHGEFGTFQEQYKNIFLIGENGDLPLDIRYMPVYIKIIQSGRSIIFNMKDLTADEEEFGSFVIEWFKSLWREQTKNPKPLLVVIEEASLVAPQTLTSDPRIKKRLSVMKMILTGGRKFGMFFILTTQRPADLNKAVLSQCHIRLFGKVTEAVDVAAISQYLDMPTEEKYYKDHTIETTSQLSLSSKRKYIREKLSNLKIGQFYLYGFGKTKIVTISSERKTRDGAKTPQFKINLQKKRNIKDIEELKKMIEEINATVPQETRVETTEDFLRELKRRDKKIKELEKQADVTNKLLIAIKKGITQGFGKVNFDISNLPAPIKKELETPTLEENLIDINKENEVLNCIGKSHGMTIREISSLFGIPFDQVSLMIKDLNMRKKIRVINDGTESKIFLNR